MKKISRRLFLKAVAATGVVSTMAACGEKGGKDAVVSGEAASELASQGDKTYTPVGEYPVVQDGVDITLTGFGPLRGSCTTYDMGTNAVTDWLVEKTGVKMTIQTCLEVDAKQKLNTIMLGGDYPDMLLFSGNYPMTLSELALYGSQGSLIPLNDLIDNYMPNLLDVFEEYPHIRDAITLPDGNIYALPQIGSARHSYNSQKMWINTTWLDEVGMEMPTTTDELFDVLQAFKDQDPSGTGKCVPLSGSLGGWNTSPLPFLMNAFTHYNVTKDNVVGLVRDNDGKVVYPQTTEGWKQGLKYMNSLCNAGLLDPLTFTQTGKDLQALGNNPEVAILGASFGGSIASFLSLGDSDRWLDYKTIPPLEGPDGVRCAVYQADTGSAGLAITSKCKDPIAVARVFDVNYTMEGVLWNRMGVEGTDYLIATGDEKNFDGEPAEYIRVTNSSEKGDNSWAQLGPWGIPTDHDLLYEANMNNIEFVLYDETVKKYEPYSAKAENLVLPVAMTEEQSRRVVDVEVPMSSYVNQCTAEFIMGQKDIDAEWDNYVATVEGYGLADYLAVYQEIYDAK